MTIHTTPNYGIAYVDLDTALVDLAAASQSMAQTVDAALGRGGVAPYDVTSLAAEVNARTTADTALGNRATALETATGKTAWTALPLANGAAVLAGFRTPQYRVIGGDRLELRGVVATLPANGTAFATLPAGVRPSVLEVLSTTSDANANRIDVQASGAVLRSAGAGAYITLTGQWFSLLP